MAKWYVFQSNRDLSTMESNPMHSERDAKAIDHLSQKGWHVVREWDDDDETFIEDVDDGDSLPPVVAVGDLPGIDNRLAGKLRIGGYKTSDDLRRASDEALLDVEGVANKSLTRIRLALDLYDEGDYE